MTLPFTVFTPTFNRAHTLPRVAESLLRQPPEMLEWLIVDDGSSDDTAAVVDGLRARLPFQLTYIRRENGGKHRAHNTAIEHARGELTIILDSDDELVPGALDLLWNEWTSIPPAERAGLAGIIGHATDQHGQLIGAPYGRPRVRGSYFELSASNVMVGEKLPCYRTDILRMYPFPAHPRSTEYVPEGVVWARVGQTYPVQCIDRAVRVYHRDASDDCAIMNTYSRPTRGAWGRMEYCRVVLDLSPSHWPRFAPRFMRAAAGYIRYGLHFGVPLLTQFSRLRGLLPRSLWLAAAPVGIASWLRDRLWER